MDEFLALARHPRLARLNDYLIAKAPPGKLPGRQHIEPTEIPDLIPWLHLLDVVPQATGEPRFRVRLAGTEVVKHHGRESTGKFLDEVIVGSLTAEILGKCLEAVRTGRPNYRRSVVAAPGRDHVHYERVVFPLARDGDHVDMLAVIYALDPDEAS
jgi:hypothetical protein